MTMQPLIGRIEQTLTDLEQVVRRVELLRDKAQQSDDDYWDGVGLNLRGLKLMPIMFRVDKVIDVDVCCIHSSAV